MRTACVGCLVAWAVLAGCGDEGAPGASAGAPQAGSAAAAGATAAGRAGGGAAGASGRPKCTPGKQEGCVCPGGVIGAQVCADDGSRFGPCLGCGGQGGASAGAAGQGGASSGGGGASGGQGGAGAAAAGGAGNGPGASGAGDAGAGGDAGDGGASGDAGQGGAGAAQAGGAGDSGAGGAQAGAGQGGAGQSGASGQGGGFAGAAGQGGAPLCELAVAFPPCDSCLDEACCAEQVVCAATYQCKEHFNCLLTCGDHCSDCDQFNGSKALTDLLDCLSKGCGVLCSNPAENTAALCVDGKDNDGDGKVDCGDSDCAQVCAGAGGNGRSMALAGGRRGAPFAAPIEVHGDPLAAAARAGAGLPPAIPFGLLPTKEPAYARKNHTLTLLADGRVLIAGGEAAGPEGTVLAEAEIYDPFSGTYTPAGTMKAPRRSHGATMRSDGRVVLLGGSDGSDGVSPAPEVFDHRLPVEEAFSVLASAGALPHVVSPIVPLSHGEALVFSRPVGAPPSKVATHAFRVDLFTGAATLAGALLHPRRCFAGVLLSDGRVLIAQGDGEEGALASSEIFDPTSNTWTKHAETPQARSGCGQGVDGPLRALRLANGDVVLSPHDPSDKVHLYKSDLQAFSVPLQNNLPDRQLSAGTMALLPSGFFIHFSSIFLPRLLSRFKNTTNDLFVWPGNSLASGSAGDPPPLLPDLIMLPHGEIFGVGLNPEGEGSNTFFWLDLRRTTRRATIAAASRIQDFPLPLNPKKAVALAGHFDTATGAIPAPLPSPIPRQDSGPTIELSNGEFVPLGEFEPAGLFQQSAYPFGFERFSKEGNLLGAGCPPSVSDLLPLEGGDLLVRIGADVLRRYSPATQLCSPLALALNQGSGTVAALPGGRALLVGSVTPSAVDPWQDAGEKYPEVLEPGASAFTLLPEKTALPHWGGHLVQPLAGGRALVAGGFITLNGPEPTSYAEVLDVATGKGKLTANPMSVARNNAQAVALPDGKVLVTDAKGTYLQRPVRLETFDPETNTFADVVEIPDSDNLLNLRWRPDLQRVLLFTLRTSGGRATVWYYDPTTRALSQPADPGAAIPSGSALTRLASGGLLLSGATIQEIDPATLARTQVAVGAPPRSYHTATLLASGRVLLAGGLDQQGTPRAALEEYDPLTRTLTKVGSLSEARSQHTATILPDGRILLAGGDGGQEPLATMELYTPGQPGTQPLAVKLQSARADHGAALLAGGRILLVGGGSSLTNSTEYYDPTTQTVEEGPVIKVSGTARVAALPDGGALVQAQDTYRLDAQGEFAPFDAVTPFNLVSPPHLLPGGNLVSCTALECRLLYPRGGSSEPFVTRDASDGSPVSERTASGGVLLVWPTSASEPIPDLFSFDAVPQATVRPSLAAPTQPLVSGQPTTLPGERLLRRAVAGGEAAAHPSAFPMVVWMPEAGGSVVADVTQATDDSVTFTLPKTVYRGPGFLHAIVTGVPSQGVFAVLQGLSQGSSCASDKTSASDAFCESNHCADGVCCDQACDGACQACSAKRKGQGDEGVCGLLATETPAPGCGKAPEGTCGPSGFCAGQGQCATNDGAPCDQGGSCKGGTCVLPAPVCNGAGDALQFHDGTSKSCVPFRCEGGQCLSSCANNEQCQAGFSCTADKVCRRCASPFEVEILDDQQTPSKQSCGDYRCRDGACRADCDDGDPITCAASLFCRQQRCRRCADEATVQTGQDKQACERFACVEGACRTDCSEASHCQVGWACVGNDCVPGCKDEQTEQRGPNPQGCKVGYRCVQGGCATECASNRECQSSFTCERGQCVRQEEKAAPQAPGACSLSPRGASQGGLLWAFAALGRARRRRSEPAR